MWIYSFITASLCLAYCVQYSHCFGRGDIAGNLLRAVLSNEGSPAVISAKVCWPKNEQVAFVKSLPHMIQFVQSPDHLIPVNTDHINKVYFFADMNCSDSRSFLDSVDETFFSHPYRWVLMSANKEKFSSFPFLPDSNVILADGREKGSFELIQVYKIEKHHEDLITEPYGLWTHEKGVEDARSSKVLARRRRNLMGKRFKASIVILNKDSLNHLDDYLDKHIDTISKATYITTLNLIGSLNATTEYMITDTWGYLNPKTGVYSGMTGHLQRKEADIGGTILYMVPDRVPLIEYLTMTSPTKAHFVFRPPPLSYVSNIYYLPFSGIVWICTICFILFCSAVLYLSYRFGWDQMMKRSPRSDFILIAVGTACQMGSQISPKVLSGRISLFCFCIGMVFIYTSYTANIVALLQSTTKSINTIEDLMHSSMEYGIEDTPYARHYFPATIEPTRKAFYKAKIEGKPSTYVNLSYGIENMRKGLYAMHMEVGVGYKQIKDTFLEHEKCGLVEIQFIEQIDPWFAIQKHSPYKEILKTNLIRLRELGIQSRGNAKLYTAKPTCGSKGQNFGSVRLIDCYAVWLVLGYGCAASMIILLIEYITKKKMSCLRGRRQS